MQDSTFLARELHAALDELEAVLMPDGTLPLLGPEARLAQDELADLAALAAVRWKALPGNLWRENSASFLTCYLGEAGKMQFESLDESGVDSAGPRERGGGNPPHGRAAEFGAGDLRAPAGLTGGAPGLYELRTHPQQPPRGGGFREGSHRKNAEYFPCARAHNILLVDGHEPRWQSAEGLGKSAISGILLAAVRGCGWLNPGFGFLGLQHERAWFRLENNAWLILDWLDGQGVHRCTSLIHFYPTFEIVAGVDRALARSRACRFAVIPVAAAKPSASVSRGDHPQFPGWFSPEFGVKFPAAVLALDWTGVELPWLGGVLITGGADKPFRQVETDPRRRARALGNFREDLRLANEIGAWAHDRNFTGPTGRKTNCAFSRRHRLRSNPVGEAREVR